MSQKTRTFLHRRRQLAGEALKFSIVGAVNMVINFAVFIGLAATLFTGSELKANIVAVVVATTSSYLMNRHWTFRHRNRSTVGREYPLFFLFNAVGLAIELAVMGAAKYGLGLTALSVLTIAKALGIGLGTIFRFWAYRTFVFTRQPGTPAAATTERVDAERVDEEYAELAAPLEAELAGALADEAEWEAERAAQPERARAAGRSARTRMDT